MDKPIVTDEKPLKKYRMPYNVKGVHALMPMFILAEGRSAEEAASNALTELTKQWTKKIGGVLNTPSQAQVEVGFYPSWDDVPVYVPDYQI